MQTLDVISVNIWQIVISLCNLLILFLLLKRFLFKPVREMLNKRQSEIDRRYEAAEKAERDAEAAKRECEHKLINIRAEADQILDSARSAAEKRGEKIAAEAQDRADAILRQAAAKADREHKKAMEEIKSEIVDVSSALAEKLLEREIDADDHREFIDSFLGEIGE